MSPNRKAESFSSTITESKNDSAENSVDRQMASSEYERMILSIGLREQKKNSHSHTQDASCIDMENKIFAVFDGAGGAGGNPEAAARVAAETIGQVLSETSNEVDSYSAIKAELVGAFDLGRQRVAADGEGGTTVATAAKIYNVEGSPVLGVAHAGDTRLFVYSEADKNYVAVTPDQSNGNRIHNGLYSADRAIAPDRFLFVKLNPGDKIMLCSDGITGDYEDQFLSNDEFLDAFTQSTAEESAQRFLELSKKSDDKTVIVINVGVVEGQVGATGQEAANAEDSQQVNMPKAAMSDAERRRNARRIRDERRAKEFSDRLASLDKNDVVSPVDIMEAFANDDELQAQIAAAQGHRDSDESDKSSLGFSDMVRIAGNVEKHSDKVAKYEELAAAALAKRMKGRLFKPLRRKTQEADVDFDDTMRMLDRFTMALDNSLMQQMLLEGKTDEEAAESLAEHQQMRAEARAEKNRTEFTKGKVASWLDKYANLSTKKKIIYGLGAGAVIATAGAGLAVAGGAFAVVGGAGLAVAKVGKTYAQKRSELYRTDANEVLSPNVSTLDEDGNVTKRSVREQVIAAKDHNQVQREKAIKKADRNKKLATGLAVASGILVGAGVAMKVAEHSDDIQKIWNKPLMPEIPTEVGNADGSWVTEVPAPTPEPIPTPAPFEFSVDASTVTNGEGWYQTIQETTGVTNPAEQAAILQKIGPALQEKGWAYPMNDGTWGISRPGKLPKDVLELIKNSR